MKLDQKKIAVLLVVFVDCLVGWLIFDRILKSNDQVNAQINSVTFYESVNKTLDGATTVASKQKAEDERKALIVYDNMTLDELAAKLEKSMNSSLKGKGYLFASYSIELGLDPYLALAITLQETGCAYSCSALVRTNNNIGGLKGSNGKYMSFSSLDDGIKSYLDIVYKRYYSKGLTTPELMNPVYAESTTWASKVNNYIKSIKAK